MKPDQLPSLLKAKLKKGVFVEVGTWEGDYSYELLKQTKCSKLYCVDPYKHFDDSSYPDGMNMLSQEQFDSKYDTVCKRFSQFGDRVEFIRKLSNDAASRFEDESLDFVYIDGNHKCKYVLEDLNNWYNKIKPGGIIICDDASDVDDNLRDENGDVFIRWNQVSFGAYGVIQACKIFTKTLNIPFFKWNNQILIYKPL
jgi:SAM-dependent methyltransferase